MRVACSKLAHTLPSLWLLAFPLRRLEVELSPSRGSLLLLQALRTTMAAKEGWLTALPQGMLPLSRQAFPECVGLPVYDNSRPSDHASGVLTRRQASRRQYTAGMG